MASTKHRVDYDLVAHLYDEPGRDYKPDPDLIRFLKAGNIRAFSSTRVLDMGCGTGKQLAADHARYPRLRLVGLDRFGGMLQQAHRRCDAVSWVQGDSAHPPFAADSFDYITNQFSYHHVTDKWRVITEAYRILERGGRYAIMNVDPWSMPAWIIYTYFPASRERDLSDFLPGDELTAMMQRAGFCNVQVRRRTTRSQERLTEFLAYASQRYRTSQLMAIADRDYQQGLSQLREHIAQLGEEARVPSEICLVWVTGDKSAEVGAIPRP